MRLCGGPAPVGRMSNRLCKRLSMRSIGAQQALNTRQACGHKALAVRLLSACWALVGCLVGAWLVLAQAHAHAHVHALVHHASTCQALAKRAILPVEWVCMIGMSWHCSRVASALCGAWLQFWHAWLGQISIPVHPGHAPSTPWWVPVQHFQKNSTR